MEYLFLFTLLGVLVVVTLNHMSVKEEREEWEKREQRASRKLHVEHIRKTFPRAFDEYWGKPDKANEVYKNFSTIMLNKDCINWTDYQWGKLEDYLCEQQQNTIDRKMWLMTKFDEMKNKYPYGLPKYLEQENFSIDKNPTAIIENIIKNVESIEKLEKEFTNSEKNFSAKKQ